MNRSSPLTFSSLYRLQLSDSFSIREAIALLPYLKELGVEGVYFSPYFQADAPHGYAITDPNQVNSKLGSMDDFNRLSLCLKEHDLAHVVDVVPNHMGIMRGKNVWWQDLLYRGSASPYVSFFDINWKPEKRELKDKIFLPILLTTYQDVLNKKEIQLHKSKEGFYFLYKETPLPLSVESLPEEGEVDFINDDPKRMHELLEKQHYHLGSWHRASPEINYRSFFNIHDLAAIRIENNDLLEAHHKWLFALMREGVVDCLRIDHPDGLYDPAAYFKKLKEVAPLPIIVEKILFREEGLPPAWDVEGSVGYDYLNQLNALFIERGSEKKLTSIYENFIGEVPDFESLLYEAKKLCAHDYMASEVGRLALLLEELAEGDLIFRDLSLFEFKELVEEVLASFPTYRSYIEPKNAPSERDMDYFKKALQVARERASHIDASLFDFFEQILSGFGNVKGEKYREFILRFQQLSAPIMAKGLEDTLFYRYNRLLSLNEVGGNPSHFGAPLSLFHKFIKTRVGSLSFSPSATHDTKQSEDVRMRLNVLSELSEEWGNLVTKWGVPSGIDPNSSYFIYQSLLGVWPKEELTPFSRKSFIERLWPIMQKTLREAKEQTNWLSPNHEYEEKVRRWIEELCAPLTPFLSTFLPFQKKIDRLGSLNTLSAQVIRIGTPGIVDIYQGSELFKYSLVDPDNRKNVNFFELEKKLESIKNKRAVALYEKEEWDSLKLLLIHKFLSFRREAAHFFLHGEYIPLEIVGKREGHVVAFMRQLGDKIVLVLASRFYATLGKATGSYWEGTEILLAIEGRKFIDLFTKKKVETRGSILHLSDIFSELPFSVLYEE